MHCGPLLRVSVAAVAPWGALIVLLKASGAEVVGSLPAPKRKRRKVDILPPFLLMMPGDAPS